MISLNQFIDEAKFQDIGKPGIKASDLDKQAYSHGIELGKGVKGNHHLDYPDAKFIDKKNKGKSARTPDGKVIGGDANSGGTTVTSNTHGTKIRDAIKASGRLDKRQPARDARRKEQEANRARKKKQRDPFTREHTEWWVGMFRLDETNGEQEKARRKDQMDKGILPAARSISNKTKANAPGLIGTRNIAKPQSRAPKPEFGAGKTGGGTGLPKKPMVTANSDVAAARARRKQREQQATKAPAANSDVAAARARRKQLESIKAKETPNVVGDVQKAREKRKMNAQKDREKKNMNAQVKRAPSIAPQKKATPAPQSKGQSAPKDSKSNDFVKDKTVIAKDSGKPKTSKSNASQPSQSASDLGVDPKTGLATDSRGFRSGLKTGFGGDVLDKNDARRGYARRELGHNVAKGIRNAPGKAVGAAAKGAGSLAKTLMKKQTQDGELGSESSVKSSAQMVDRGSRK